MPAYYFAMEGYHTGEKPDPAVDKLITIQYQKIDLTTGEPLGELTILKEWESSEQQIITTFYNEFFRPEMPVTHFIPVGMSLDYEYEMIIAKCRQYKLPAITSHQLYFQRPRFDLRSIVVLLNDGRFAGARLDLFSSKKYDGSHMRKWYENKDFKKIEHFVREETEAVLKLLQYLSKYKTRLGITKKEEGGPRKPAPAPSSARGEPVLPARQVPARPHPASPKSPAPSMQAAKKPADARSPAPKKSPAKLLKAEPGTQRKGSAQLGKAESGDAKRSSGKAKSAAPRSSAPPSQFRKHAPTRNTSTRKPAERRR
ncbi:MAG: hypothetical protein CVV30_06370 [Methanomicrobiales archaeon HGW-Methanomicrobiales-1]|jgi:hypothetical protein|nr:MAG: hypothetical protein CVV30_06370 [Methanomicrobiales archaeon HGW-Methanomicrobiales-1]